MTISQIIDKIQEKQLFVPAFQREYVWKKKNAKELVASLIKEYPTGTMLTWETNTPPELKGKHKYSEKQGAVKLILDGQQRITTLYMLITGDLPPYYQEHEILNDIRGLFVNVKTLSLEYSSRLHESDPFWVNITDIFQRKIRKRDVVNALEEKNNGERLSRDLDDVIDDNFGIIQEITNREFPEQIIPPKASIKEAIDIFYIVNASGVNLTDAELALAQISGYWPEARERFKQKLVELEKQGMVFKLDFIIYVLLGIIHQMGSKMDRLHSKDNREKIIQVWEKLEDKLLDYVLNIIKDRAYVDHTKEINSVYALVPIIVYAYYKGSENLSEKEINKAVKWFYYSQIRQRYISQLQQKLDKDVKIAANEKNPFDQMINQISVDRPLEISKEEFIGATVSNALWGLMRFYFKSQEAKCLTTGVNIRTKMGKKYALEWDHIFPYSILKQNGYSQNIPKKYQLAQEITNRAVLTATENRIKSNSHAEDYLNQVVQKFPKALSKQVIPEDRELWKLENFELFLDKRRGMLAKELNDFLNNLDSTESIEGDSDLINIIKAGENSEVEFKTTLRYDMREKKVNKKLEEVVLKTIAAFSNRSGGTLIMGVDDEMNIIGLDNDYKTLKNGTKDEFELQIRNLVNNAYGIQFATNNLNIEFPEVEDVEICTVEIKPGLEPIYSEVTDKNGNRSKKFYVRSGNSSQEVPLDEIAQYINDRFNK